jgi:hypothetical protein
MSRSLATVAARESPIENDLDEIRRTATIFRFVDQLPADQRTVIIERYVEERSIREVGRAAEEERGRRQAIAVAGAADAAIADGGRPCLNHTHGLARTRARRPAACRVQGAVETGTRKESAAMTTSTVETSETGTTSRARARGDAAAARQATPAAAIDFYTRAFGAREVMRFAAGAASRMPNC